MPSGKQGPPRRRSLRIANFDYSNPCAYFVTICSHERKPLFGNIRNGHMNPNPLGEIVSECWYELPYHYARLELVAFVLMPNHIHAVIGLHKAVGAGLRPAPSLSEIVRALKSFSSRRIRQMSSSPDIHIWQRGYYEHIVRGGEELDRIRHYILKNPARWEFDRENAKGKRHDDREGWDY